MRSGMKYKAMILLLLLVLTVCCSCNGQAYSDRGGEGEENLNTTSMAHTIFKNSETTAKEKRLENDYIRVWKRGEEDDEDAELIQENLDGTEQKRVDIPYFYEVYWLTNDWIYYGTYWDPIGWDGQEAFYRAPIHYENDHATIDLTQKENLYFKGEEVEYTNFMVTDSYILYASYKENLDASPYFRYDFETGKSTKLRGLDPEADILCERATDLPILQGDAFFLYDDLWNYIGSRNTLICEVSVHNLEAVEMKLGTLKGMAEYEGDLYYISKKNKKSGLWKRGEDGGDTCLFTREQLEKAIEKMDLWPVKTGEKEIKMGEIGFYQDKIYLSVYLVLSDSYDRYLLLSAKISDPSQWEVEAPLTDYLQGKKKEGAQIEEIDGGKVLVSYGDDVGSKGHKAVIYDITTGEIQELDDTDYRFWLRESYKYLIG